MVRHASAFSAAQDIYSTAMAEQTTDLSFWFAQPITYQLSLFNNFPLTPQFFLSMMWQPYIHILVRGEAGRWISLLHPLWGSAVSKGLWQNMVAGIFNETDEGTHHDCVIWPFIF